MSKISVFLYLSFYLDFEIEAWTDLHVCQMLRQNSATWMDSSKTLFFAHIVHVTLMSGMWQENERHLWKFVGPQFSMKFDNAGSHKKSDSIGQQIEGNMECKIWVLTNF